MPRGGQRPPGRSNTVVLAGVWCSGIFSMSPAAQPHAPALSGFGFNMVGPAIIKFGTAEQQAQFLPKILNADLWFCQGYSEPQAGSDLASVRTRADRDGDDYVVNGSKNLDLWR